MSEYNGHRSRAAWNVALWIGNDESLYNRAKVLLRVCRTKARAAERLLSELPEATPDGVKYTKTTVLLALRGL